MLPRALPGFDALARRRASAEAIAREAAAILMHHRGRLNASPSAAVAASPSAAVATSPAAAVATSPSAAVATSPSAAVATSPSAVAGVTWKGAVDLVTIADRESETFVIAALHAAFPDDHIIGEEGGGAGPADADFVWYVDPLDGTTNFVHGLPHFAVSLGCVYRGDPAVGVILAPVLGDVWSAALGQGATKNGQPIAVATDQTLRRSLVATGFPYDRTTDAEALARRVARALAHCLDVRRLGSAALDLAQVADGTFGAYWEPRLKPWDLAAGVVIVREAGGRVTDLAGGDTLLASGDVLATNGLLHAAFLADVLA